VIVDLPYPVKALWPNGRVHWGAKSTATRKHRQWACAAMQEAIGIGYKHNGDPVYLRLTLCGKSRGPLPDADNCLAASKAYFDGMADALKVNDSLFIHAPVIYGPRSNRFLIEVVL
jgi:crossover junction endodeoxyribonuclease RusA